jgi:hypothetical protein
MTSNGDNTEDPPTSAGMDTEDYPDTAAGTSRGDAETELVPPASAAAGTAHAWSHEEPITEVLPRPWRSAWAIAGIGLLSAVIVAFAIFGVVALVKENRGSTQTAPATPAHSVPASAPASAPASTQVAPPAPQPPAEPPADDNEYVAMAISPAAIGARHTSGGYGDAGSQDKANQIALSECRANTGNDDCLLVNAGMYHGCVSYAIDSSAHGWASGSGADFAAARSDALRRLESAQFVGVHCSDPPGGNTKSAAPPPVPEPQVSAAVTPAPRAAQASDQLYMTLLSQVPGTVITDPATAVAGGRNICPSLASNGRAATEAAVQTNDPGFSPWQAAQVVNAAITAYCPQYRGVQ